MLTKLESSFYLAEIAEGIKALHTLGIIKRDLQPGNILIFLEGHIKICDLGLAELVGEKKQSIGGTLSYCSYEMLNKKPYDQKHD